VFNVASGRPFGEPLQIHSAFAYPGAFLPGNRLLTFGADEAAVWKLDSSVPTLETDLRGHTGGPPLTENGAHGQFTPDGAEIVTVGVGDKRVLVFDAATGKPRGSLLDRRVATESYLAFSPSRRIIAAGGLDGSFTLWDRASGRELSHVKTAGASQTLLAWDPHRPVLVTSDPPDSIRFWDVSDPRHPVGRRSLTAPTGLVWFSPDGRLLAVADGASVTATVFDVATGKKLLTTGGGTDLNGVGFTPDSRTLAIGIFEINGGKVLLYDTATWRHRTLILPYGPNGLAFVDGGARFVTSSFEVGGRVDLWDTATLQPVGEPLSITTADGYSAVANPRGTKVVFGSWQGVTPVLDVDPHSWQRTACRIAGRNLTRAEWAQYLPGQTYRATCPQWPASH
jgi:WD40 repeat protein